MKHKMIKMEVTELEADLIQMLRNYVSSYPNGYPQLLEAAQRMFDELAEPFHYFKTNALPFGGG